MFFWNDRGEGGLAKLSEIPYLSEMIAKCNYCGTSFDAKRNTARFCSDLHRTLFGKLSQDEKTKRFIEYIGSISTADKVPVPEAKIEAIERTNLEAIKEYEQDLGNGKRLRQFAALNKTDCDTIYSWLMDNYGKKDKGLKSPKNEKLLDSAVKTSRFTSDWRKQFIKSKTGYSPND